MPNRILTLAEVDEDIERMLREAKQMPEVIEWFDSYSASDPVRGFRVDMARQGDGRYAIQFNDGSEPIFKSTAELLSEYSVPDGGVRWIPFEVLRRYVIAHCPEFDNA